MKTIIESLQKASEGIMIMYKDVLKYDLKCISKMEYNEYAIWIPTIGGTYFVCLTNPLGWNDCKIDYASSTIDYVKHLFYYNTVYLLKKEDNKIVLEKMCLDDLSYLF